MSNKLKNEDALVLLSGGQDSTTSLYWAINNFKRIHAVSFDYSQKHSNEIKHAEVLCRDLKMDHKVIKLDMLKDIVISNLFSGEDDVNKNHGLKKDVPSSFVPYRNMIFLTLAAAWASTLKVKNLVIGVCETDYSGYADCRDIFIKSMQVSLNLATDFKNQSVVIHTPLMWLSKAEIFSLASNLGCLDIIINKTISCYNGIEKMNDFGYGCNQCPACKLRKKGYEEYKSELK